jgi:hypothetical protein
MNRIRHPKYHGMQRGRSDAHLVRRAEECGQDWIFDGCSEFIHVLVLWPGGIEAKVKRIEILIDLEFPPIFYSAPV